MENGRKLLRWIALAAIAVIGLGGLTSLFESPSVAAITRPDVIRIDAIGQHKKLEMPPAVFLHDKHTQEVAKQGGDCTTCHPVIGEGHQGFMRNSEVKDPEKLMNMFHENCIGCHVKLGEGPRDGECRTCHDAKTPFVSSPAPVKMGGNSSLHALHVGSKAITGPAGSDQNCGACHHIYDSKLEKLVWVPGTEDACSSCHGEKAEGEKPALKDAVHTKCVWCHTDVASAQRAKAMGTAKPAVQGKKLSAQQAADIEASIISGPTTCAGCHTLEAQKAFKQLTDIPRLMRGQPDAVLLTPVDSNGKRELSGAGMKPVVFNHKTHEMATESCSTCHHVKIASCTECHTIEGTAAGKQITLGQAMHSVKAGQSCVGCHQKTLMEKPQCAGCHGSMKAMTEQSCAVCHADVPGLTAAHLADGPANSEQLNAQLTDIANRHLAEKAAPVKSIAPEEIPEYVEIGSLSNEYMPSRFPHRKIYEALLNGTNGNGMAAAFHSAPTTLCAACHHKSPQADLLTPPRCANCHGSQADKMAVDANRPSLKAAYHQQCMACHDRMGITKPANTDCTGCHAHK